MRAVYLGIFDCVLSIYPPLVSVPFCNVPLFIVELCSRVAVKFLEASLILSNFAFKLS